MSCNDFEIVEDLLECGHDVDAMLADSKQKKQVDELKIMNSVPYPHPTNKFVDYGNEYYRKKIKPVTLKQLHKRGKKVSKAERGTSSVELLTAMGHNPVSSLLNTMKRVENELARLDKLRDEGGRVSQVAYNELLGQLAKINTDLLRYRYSRVSEAVTAPNNPMGTSLNITLTTPETYKKEEQEDETA